MRFEKSLLKNKKLATLRNRLQYNMIIKEHFCGSTEHSSPLLKFCIYILGSKNKWNLKACHGLSTHCWPKNQEDYGQRIHWEILEIFCRIRLFLTWRIWTMLIKTAIYVEVKYRWVKQPDKRSKRKFFLADNLCIICLIDYKKLQEMGDDQRKHKTPAFI